MNLPNLVEYRNQKVQDMKKRSVKERIAKCDGLPEYLQKSWATADDKRDIKFHGSTVIIYSKESGSIEVFSSVCDLLLAVYVFDYVELLRKYASLVQPILQELPKEQRTKVVNDAKSNNSDFLITKINSSNYSDDIKINLTTFVSDYSAWGGKKSIDRNDFWQSTMYDLLGLVMSSSSVHAFILMLLDNKSNLYTETSKWLDSYLNSFDKSLNTDGNNQMSILDLFPIVGENRIFYGAPGTGKSYRIQKYIQECGIPDYSAQKGHPDVFRITLHPEFSYSDFVGQLLPTIEKNDNGEDVPTYKMIPGEFTSALKRALEQKNFNRPVFLILEEMSRANVAAVFGDLFQLLDRDDEGRSEYTINNAFIAEKAFDQPAESANDFPVYLPSNLYIIGTVNTSDQNVFAMDTAFKRRFKWSYVSPTDVDLKNFKNNPELTFPNGLSVSWYEFYTTLNEFIVTNLHLTEDKQIGPYFIKFSDNSSVMDYLRDKLLQYLWEDVQAVANGRSIDSNLFNDEIHSFSELYDKFGKQRVFSKSFVELLKKNTHTDQDEEYTSDDNE